VNTQSAPNRIRRRAPLWMLAVLAVPVAVIVFHMYAYLFGGGKDAAAPSPVPVHTAPAELEQVDIVLEQAADIKPWKEVFLISKIKGQRILEIAVERGDRVALGQVLARLDTAACRAKRDEAAARLAEARASRSVAEAQLAVLERDRERFVSLMARQAAPAQKLDHIDAEHRAAQAHLRLAEAQIDAAHALLTSLDISLADHEIRAPMDGVVAVRFVDPGALSSDSDPMFLLTSDRKIRIITSLAEQDYPLARAGQLAEIRVDAFPGESFPGRVEVLSPILDPATRSAELEIVLDNEDLRFRPGMYARVRLVLGTRRVLTVPRQAVNRMPGAGTWYVFTVEEEEARQVNVEVGPMFGVRREIRSGLEPGQEVVIQGAGLLKDGMPVYAVLTEETG